MSGSGRYAGFPRLGFLGLGFMLGGSGDLISSHGLDL